MLTGARLDLLFVLLKFLGVSIELLADPLTFLDLQLFLLVSLLG